MASRYAGTVRAPEFPPDAEWIGPRLRLRDLRGKLTLLDFWTYCCINCMHILPELKKLEQKYPNQLVVIGVHSAKFETEQDTQNIREAILRYEIEHPVVNDPQQAIWNRIGVNAWPTIIMIDPAGEAVFYKAGETKASVIDELIDDSIGWYRRRGLLDESPVRFELAKFTAEETPLRFPGKVIADGPSQRLFVADSNHNRIVITDLAGKLIDIIGSGREGKGDGGFEEAEFDKPQGMVVRDGTLYIADTENHLLRKADLAARTVTTIAGTGVQADNGFPGLDPEATRLSDLPRRWVGPPTKTKIASPWDLWIHEDELFIAMAGPHQIWKMPLDESVIGPYAGNGREDIVDGSLLPRIPYQEGFSSFAQPSGLSSDGKVLFVADSEGSSVRTVPLDGRGKVETLVGTSNLPVNRLFTFGDVDGDRRTARFQHCLGVAFHDGTVYVADTYNNKIRAIEVRNGAVTTFVGDGEAGATDEPARFDEPAGISYLDGKLYVADTNNHAIRVIDVATRATTTLTIAGLEPPAKPTPPFPSFAGAREVTADALRVTAVDGRANVEIAIAFPAGWKLNPFAPQRYYLLPDSAQGVVSSANLPTTGVDNEPAAVPMKVSIPVDGDGTGSIKVGFEIYYCQDGGEGLCKVAPYVVTIPLTVAADGSAVGSIPLRLPR